MKGCTHNTNLEAITQLDRNFPPKCWYPQVSFLDEIHQEHPNATFVLIFRPVKDWIKSVKRWTTLFRRLTSPGCVYRIPGFVTEHGTATEQDLENWWCTHVQHVREFVKQYPTHSLIELDLYDTRGTSQAMASLFRTNETCWGKHNSNP
ncbi:hypothetical protein ACHAXR_004050 [Thalassiosira sp. AJA248-18]